MFALLTILTVLIGSMFVAMVVSTMNELRSESVELEANKLRRNGRR